MKLAWLFLRALVWGLLGFGLAAGVFLGRLSTGPVMLDWMRPNIEDALTPGYSDLDVTVGQTALRLDKSSRTIELVGMDVRYLDEGGRPILTFPEVKVALSVEALLNHGLIAASKVEARAPSLRLTRSADGSIGLHSTEMDDDDAMADVDFPTFVRHFVLAPETDTRIAYLNYLKISGGELFFDDHAHAKTRQAKAADLIMVRRQDGVNGWMRADLVQEEANASIQLRARVDQRAERVHLDADIIDLAVADLIEPWPSELSWLPPELKDIRTPLRASVKGALDFDGTVSPLEVEMHVADSAFDLPAYLARPLDVTSLDARAILAPDFETVDLVDLRLASLGAELTAKGQVSWRDQQPDIALDLTASNVRAEDLPAFWPPGFGDDARSWILENIETGRISTAEASLDLDADDFGPEPLKHDAVQGHFAFEGLSIRYVDTMPPIEQGRGMVSFDADRLQVDIGSGNNAGVDLTGGTVTISGLGKPGKKDTLLHVMALTEGSIDEALSLLDHPPLDVAKELEIAPEQTSGAFSGNLDVRLPLYNDVANEEVEVIADAALSDVAIAGLPRLGEDSLLDNGNFALAIDATTVRLDGTADVDGLPLEIDIEEPRDEGTAKRRIVLDGELDQTVVGELDFGIDGIGGALAFSATLTETSDNIWVDLEADLTDLVVDIPGLAWKKSAPDKGQLLASIAVPNEGPVEVKHVELTARDFRVVGNLILSAPDYQLIELALSEAQLGDSSGTVRLRRDADDGRELVVDAAVLDLDSLLSDEDGAFELDQLKMAMRADQLTFKGIEVFDMQADAYHGKDAWRTASFLGTLASGSKIALELAPEGDAQRLDIRSDDAGALIRALDLGQRIEGGEFYLAAKLMSQKPLSAEGRLQLRRFTIADAPLLARLLTVASFTGIGNLLEGEGIETDELVLPFSMQDRKLTIADGLLRGSELGLTTKGTIDLEQEVIDLSGTIIPVYSLNRLIGQVPIIGRILTGIEGRGAFAATYEINGPRSQPTVYVNPLSILTPGLIRDFFGGLIEGTLTPPEPRETDD